jgi:hypothetical protein
MPLRNVNAVACQWCGQSTKNVCALCFMFRIVYIQQGQRPNYSDECSGVNVLAKVQRDTEKGRLDFRNELNSASGCC